jgi:hypothetical protein
MSIKHRIARNFMKWTRKEEGIAVPLGDPSFWALRQQMLQTVRQLSLWPENFCFIKTPKLICDLKDGVVAGCSETLALIYQTIRRHMPEVCDPNLTVLTRSIIRLLLHRSQTSPCNFVPLWNFSTRKKTSHILFTDSITIVHYPKFILPSNNNA